MDGNFDIIMEDFNSKYSGEEVEALLDQVASGNAAGGSKEFVEVEPHLETMGYYGSFETLTPNNVYVFTEPIYSLGVVGFVESNPKWDEYSIMFTASKDDVTITLPLEPYKIYWANGVVPTISSGDLCELSLMRIGYNIKAVLTTFKEV